MLFNLSLGALLFLLPVCVLAYSVSANSLQWVSPADRKQISVKGGHKYSYIFIKAKGKKPTFLLVHGFPSSVYDWRKQIADLTAAGYGVIAPDLLGYGETSHPASVEEYSRHKISASVVEILEHEGLKQVIGVGHDW